MSGNAFLKEEFLYLVSYWSQWTFDNNQDTLHMCVY